MYTRGEVDKPGAVAPRGFLQVMSVAPAKIQRSESGRLELANWIASKNNPLAERPITTVPAQSLYLLNSAFVMRAADAAADKLLKDTTTDTERIRAAYKAAAKKDRTPAFRRERDAWAAFAQAMMGSAEFQYRK